MSEAFKKKKVSALTLPGKLTYLFACEFGTNENNDDMFGNTGRLMYAYSPYTFRTLSGAENVRKQEIYYRKAFIFIIA